MPTPDDFASWNSNRDEQTPPVGLQSTLDIGAPSSFPPSIGVNPLFVGTFLAGQQSNSSDQSQTSYQQNPLFEGTSLGGTDQNQDARLSFPSPSNATLGIENQKQALVDIPGSNSPAQFPQDNSGNFFTDVDPNKYFQDSSQGAYGPRVDGTTKGISPFASQNEEGKYTPQDNPVVANVGYNPMFEGTGLNKKDWNKLSVPEKIGLGYGLAEGEGSTAKSIGLTAMSGVASLAGDLVTGVGSLTKGIGEFLTPNQLDYNDDGSIKKNADGTISSRKGTPGESAQWMMDMGDLVKSAGGIWNTAAGLSQRLATNYGDASVTKGSIVDHPENLTNWHWWAERGSKEVVGMAQFMATVAGMSAGGVGVVSGIQAYNQTVDKLIGDGVDASYARLAGAAAGLVSGLLDFGSIKFSHGIPHAEGVLNKFIDRVKSGAVLGGAQYIKQPFDAAFEGMAEGKGPAQIGAEMAHSLYNIEPMIFGTALGAALHTNKDAWSDPSLRPYDADAQSANRRFLASKDGPSSRADLGTRQSTVMDPSAMEDSGYNASRDVGLGTNDNGLNTSKYQSGESSLFQRSIGQDIPTVSPEPWHESIYNPKDRGVLDGKIDELFNAGGIEAVKAHLPDDTKFQQYADYRVKQQFGNSEQYKSQMLPAQRSNVESIVRNLVDEYGPEGALARGENIFNDDRNFSRYGRALLNEKAGKLEVSQTNLNVPLDQTSSAEGQAFSNVLPAKEDVGATPPVGPQAAPAAPSGAGYTQALPGPENAPTAQPGARPIGLQDTQPAPAPIPEVQAEPIPSQTPETQSPVPSPVAPSVMVAALKNRLDPRAQSFVEQNVPKLLKQGGLGRVNEVYKDDGVVSQYARELAQQQYKTNPVENAGPLAAPLPDQSNLAPFQGTPDTFLKQSPVVKAPEESGPVAVPGGLKTLEKAAKDALTELNDAKTVEEKRYAKERFDLAFKELQSYNEKVRSGRPGLEPANAQAEGVTPEGMPIEPEMEKPEEQDKTLADNEDQFYDEHAPNWGNVPEPVKSKEATHGQGQTETLLKPGEEVPAQAGESSPKGPEPTPGVKKGGLDLSKVAEEHGFLVDPTLEGRLAEHDPLTGRTTVAEDVASTPEHIDHVLSEVSDTGNTWRNERVEFEGEKMKASVVIDHLSEQEGFLSKLAECLR